MDDWEILNETFLSEKDNFHSHFIMEDITDAYYTHSGRVSADFEIKHLGEYHELYVQRDTLMLANVFENFRNVQIWSCKISFSTSITMVSSLKNTKVKLDLLTILLMVEKGIRGGIFHSIYWYASANNK